MDVRYNAENVADADRPVFQQLEFAFPTYEIWRRLENFDRFLSAGVVNRADGAAATVRISRGGVTVLHVLTNEQIEQIRVHLSTAQDKDLEI